jgi:hypothetical protein
MSIDYSNVENGLSKAEKNGFFPRQFITGENLRFQWLTGQKQGYLSYRKSWILAANSAIS